MQNSRFREHGIVFNLRLAEGRGVVGDNHHFGCAGASTIPRQQPLMEERVFPVALRSAPLSYAHFPLRSDFRTVLYPRVYFPLFITSARRLLILSWDFLVPFLGAISIDSTWLREFPSQPVFHPRPFVPPIACTCVSFQHTRWSHRTRVSAPALRLRFHPMRLVRFQVGRHASIRLHSVRKAHLVRARSASSRRATKQST